MVKTELAKEYACEWPGCGRKYSEEERAVDCEAKGLVGPKIKSGLVLGSRDCVKNTWIRKDGRLVEGLPKMDFYVLKGESSPEGHEKVYDFLSVGFDAPYGDKKYEYGKKHKWSFGSAEYSISSLEHWLSFSWDNSAVIRELGERELVRVLKFMKEDPNGLELRDKIAECGVEKLRGHSPYIKKFLQDKWDDHYS